VNCPESHLQCDSLCSYRIDHKCHSTYWSEPKSVYDLMSYEELIDEIKKMVKPQTQWDTDQWDVITNLRGMVLYLQSKLNEHIDSQKKSKRKSSYD